MRRPSFLVLFSLSALLLLQDHSTWARRSSSRGSSSKSSSSSSSTSSSSSSSSHHKTSGSNTHSKSGEGAGGYPGGGSYPTHNKGGDSYSHRLPDGRGGTPNWNPSNKILSPRYGGGFGKGRGSTFAHTVNNMGYKPNVKSKGYAKMAAVAVGVGVATGVAVHYGVGRFPSPHFSVHSPREERYYNHYMQQRYGSHSTDKKDYGRDYHYMEPEQSYDSHMASCMKRTDLLPGPEGGQGAVVQGDDSAAVAAGNASQAGASALLPGNGTIGATTAPDAEGGSNGTSTPPPEIHGAPSVHPIAGKQEAGQGEEEDAVSILEIGYPELIEQQKVWKCVESYMEYSHQYLKLKAGAAPQQRPLCQGVLLLLITALTLMSSSVLLQ